MVTFTPTPSPNLFAVAGGEILLAYYLPKPPEPPPTAIGLDAALAGCGTFVLAAAPGLDVSSQAGAIAAAVGAALASPTFSGTRAIAWLLDPSLLDAEHVALLGLSAAGHAIQPGASLTWIPNNLVVVVRGGCTVKLAGDAVVLGAGTGGFAFSGAAAPLGSTIGAMTIPFSGPQAGTLMFATSVGRGEIHARLRWGFQALYATASPPPDFRSQWYPLAAPDLPSRADMLGFAVVFDPGDSTNARLPDRSYWRFTGVDDGGSPTVLASGYRTAYGDTVWLRPLTAPGDGEQAARLALTLGNPDAPGTPDYMLAPEGDFFLGLAGAKDGKPALLLCGLTPDETISFQAGPASDPKAGDRLRFVPGQAAFAAHYPPPPGSTLLPPIDPQALPLTNVFLTSYADVVPGPGGAGNRYAAQPKGATLFGGDAIVQPASGILLGPKAPDMLLTSPPPVPLLPYGLVPPLETGVSFDETTIQGVEQFAVARWRRALLGAPGATRTAAPARRAGHGASEADGDWVTTPSGLLVQYDAAGKWTSVLLGANFDAGPMWLAITDPEPALQQALQTANVFLVAANAKNLGAFATSPPSAAPPAPTGAATFYNTMAIEGWEIAANVGQHNGYGDYNNILIVKGCTGKLVDLVKKPSAWTQVGDFSIPGADSSEITVLATWLSNYLADALAQTSPYFHDFKTLVQEDDWTGVLVLKASLVGLPANIGGLLSVMQPEVCFAHHFAVRTSPVTLPSGGTAPVLTTSSSMAQLVYYVDPAYVETAAPQPVPAAGDDAWDFRLLTLKALFENTAVKSFDSLAQLMLTQFFGDAVTGMGSGTAADALDVIFLRGSYQHVGAGGVFQLLCTDDALFFLDSGVINKVEVTSAQFRTLDAAKSVFALTGFVDFLVLQAIDEGSGRQTVPFDLFSFGTPAGADPGSTRQGLAFGGLRIVMDTSDPANGPSYAFDAGAITFDASHSTPRVGSLDVGFALRVTGLLQGAASADPSGLGYLSVPTSGPLAGVGGSPWYALQFDLNLGTLGALASQAGLTSSLVFAWAPGGPQPPDAGITSYAAGVFLRLPGISGTSQLLSLEGVLSLAIGSLRLSYQAAPDGKPGDRYWVLWLSDIALRFLGLLKIPPNGAIDFACFGGPAGASGPPALGWYAVYNQNPPSTARRFPAARAPRP